MGQDRYRRRLWILPHAGGAYFESLESAEANAGKLGTWDGKTLPPIKKARWEEDPEAAQDPEEAEETEQKLNLQPEANPAPGKLAFHPHDRTSSDSERKFEG